MARHRVCPWWLGYLLASPIRRFLQDPEKILHPYVREGMAVLEPGPGMGFFTLELARRVGPSGRVVAVDIQAKMLNSLKNRLSRAGLLDRVDIRLAKPDSIGLDDMPGAMDFALVFAVVHELQSPDAFFMEIAVSLKAGARLLLVEPAGHVGASKFDAELVLADRAGLHCIERPSLGRSHAALLKKIE